MRFYLSLSLFSDEFGDVLLAYKVCMYDSSLEHSSMLIVTFFSLC